MVTSLIKQTPGILRAPGPRARESTMGRSGWVWKYRSKTSGWSCAGNNNPSWRLEMLEWHGETDGHLDTTRISRADSRNSFYAGVWGVPKYHLALDAVSI